MTHVPSTSPVLHKYTKNTEVGLKNAMVVIDLREEDEHIVAIHLVAISP